MGFVFDAPGQALRPVLGIPGASTFGDPLDSAGAISTAAISLRQNIAIVNDGAWKAIGLTPSSAAASTLPDGLPAGARVAVSESGSAAAFYDAAANALRVVTGIGSSAMATNPVSLDALPGAITNLSVGDDGSLLLAASLPSSGEALFWIDSNGARQLMTLQSSASILLWNHGAAALVVDRGANRVFQLQDPGGNAAISTLASDADGVAAPAAAALSTDGKRVWIANGGSHSVLGIDTTSRAAVSLDCGCDVTAIVPLPDGTSYRLNELNRGPVWILDAAPGAGPRVVFVPALQEDGQ